MFIFEENKTFYNKLKCMSPQTHATTNKMKFYWAVRVAIINT